MLLFGPFRFDAEKLVLYNQQDRYSLRPKVLQLLAYFLANPHQVIKRETLLSDLWQHGEYREAALTQSINELRQALGDDAQQPTYIRTLPQQGYQWICDVKAQKCARKRLKLVLALCGAAAITVGTSIVTLSFMEKVEVQEIQKSALLILPMRNETGVQANAWWGYALESVLKEHLQHTHQLLPKSQTPELLKLPTEEQPSQLRLTLKPMQQRFLLQAKLDSRHAEVVVEHLDQNFTEIAQQLLFMLQGQVARRDDHIEPSPGFADYYRGLQALNEFGPQLAKPYFEAALILAPHHLPSQLELAQIAWHQGDITHARARFAALDITHASTVLQARYYLYLGAFQKALGEFSQAEKNAQSALIMAQHSQQIELIASAYQLKADVAWHLLQWQDYTMAMNAAYALVGSRSFAYSEAQRSFYLANPPAAGPQGKSQLNLAQSKKVLSHAIEYYRQSKDKIDLAKSLFAYGQNYLVPVSESEKSLLEALQIVSDSGNLHFRMQVLTYLGFYYIQLHKGEKALYYLNQVEVNEQFNSAVEQLNLLKAMAFMDIGLTHSDMDAIQAAQRQFNVLLAEPDTSVMTRTNATLLLAWTWLKLGNLDKAQTLTERALADYQRFSINEAATYAAYTQMYIHIMRGQPERAISLVDLDKNKDAHLMLFYSSIAAHMTQNNALEKKSTEMLSVLKNSAPLLQQLDEYKQQAGRRNSIKQIMLLDAPYSVYCQSKWVLE
ncbi:winged helix-turn-helix domain-containing protein [Pseudoalteromonas sp. Of7M-16]|uniref:winged helix-turn-helix domain-containing protein n=1 Tax=Pseudoalteromonas sp. Of7M-16 TaxID=2917756 RepID=UPI001EF42B70|nr:winged helix-turn-helix domain-containing protein [Pseudoalteromonas sp. Of7M-16]